MNRRSRRRGQSRSRHLVKLLIGERKKAGLRQQDVAERLREHQSYVSKIENGKHRISVITFLDLAKAIGFDPAQVMRKLTD